MPYAIQNPEGYFLHKDEKRERMIADHGMVSTYGPFWTLKESEAKTFETWFQAEARAGILFWDRSQSDKTFIYMDSIKEIK